MSDYYGDLLTHFQVSDLPPDVIADIKAAPLRQSMDFTGQISLTDRITKATRLRFANNARIIVDNVDSEWLAIVADEIVIEAPTAKALISRPANPDAESDFAKSLAGADGTDKTRAPDGQGFDGNRNGYNGVSGADGDPGADGRTQQLPLLYIMTNQVRWGVHEDSAPASAIVVMYDGVRGGDGGDGGNGGDGGDGHVGADGDSTMFDCRHGPARGGAGGAGGAGGRGGNAGKGGDGGSVILVSPSPLISDFFLVRQEPGSPGMPGRGGRSGRGGSGGQGGNPRGNCHGNGPNGAQGLTPVTLGPGATSPTGKRGVKGFLKRNVGDLL